MRGGGEGGVGNEVVVMNAVVLFVGGTWWVAPPCVGDVGKWQRLDNVVGYIGGRAGGQGGVGAREGRISVVGWFEAPPLVHCIRRGVVRNAIWGPLMQVKGTSGVLVHCGYKP